MRRIIKVYWAVCYCYLCALTYASAARILGIFVFPGKSHFYFHETMMRPLVAAGHHVTVVAPFAPDAVYENFTVIDSRAEKRSESKTLSSVARSNVPWIFLMWEALNIMEKNCRPGRTLQKRIETAGPFDVVFIELMSMYQCYMPIVKNLKIPIIATISTRSYVNSDLSVGNVRYPSHFLTEFFFIKNKMSFYERLVNTLREIEIRIGRLMETQKVKDICADEWCDAQISLLFTNAHTCLLPRVITPNTINIGGITVKSAKLNPLPAQLETFINEAKFGVVFFSLGSIASKSSMNSATITALKNAFAKIPQRVIWKFDETIDGLTENVIVAEWLPQKEILAHKNVYAFISHGGLMSTYEGIYFGKPMILLPIFADQPNNAAILTELGVAVSLNILESTEADVLTALDAVINDTTYRKNMEQLSRKFKDEPITPSELVVYWTEYVLRHKGASHMRWTGADMPLYQYFLLDVLAFVAISSSVVVVLAYLLTKHVVFVALSRIRAKFFASKTKEKNSNRK